MEKQQKRETINIWHVEIYHSVKLLLVSRYFCIFCNINVDIEADNI